MNTSTVIYLVRGMPGHEEIFLGRKFASKKAIKRGIAGKLIGYGGDFDPTLDSSLTYCATRELSEESDFRARPEDMEQVAKIQINGEEGAGRPQILLYYYLLRKWTGLAGTSNEVIDPQWYKASPLPSDMLGSDYIVLPRVLAGKKLAGRVTYGMDMRVVSHNLTEVGSM